MANKQKAQPAGKSILDQLKEDPEALAVAFIKPSGTGKSKIATSRDILIKDGADLNNQQLFMVVTDGMVIIKKAKAMGPRTL